MEHAKKMVVVPQELISRLESSTQQQQQSPQSYVGGLDAEMQRILNDTSLANNDSEKWKQYQQVLQRYLHVAADRRRPINLPVIESATSDSNLIEDIVETLPLVYRNEARALLRALQRKGPDYITWDENGSVYVNGGRKIVGSNIVDIIHSIVRARRNARLPVGWEDVMNVLKEMNVPSSYIGSPAAHEFLNRTMIEPPPPQGSVRRQPTDDTYIPQGAVRRRPSHSLFPTPEATPRRSTSRKSLIPTPNTSPYARRRLAQILQEYDNDDDADDDDNGTRHKPKWEKY